MTNNMPTIPNPAALDFSEVADEVEAVLASGLGDRIALALLTWEQAAAGTEDAEYELVRAASSAGRLVDALDQLGSSFGHADLGAALA